MLTPDRIYHGDALSLIKELPDGSIDCIVTDPPYRVTSRGGSGMVVYIVTTTKRSPKREANAQKYGMLIRIKESQ